MNAQEIIKNKFDNIECKCFDESEIVNELCSIPETERDVFENTAEWLAFQLVEGGNNEWGTYYGPFLVKTDNTCIPSKEMITKNVLAYWEKRIAEVVNPILRTRYSGLLVDFKHNCSGDIRAKHIQAIIDIIKGNYPRYSINGINKLQRAMQLAIQSKNKETIAKVKSIIPDYETKVAKEYEAGVWGRIFLLMFENINYFSNEEIAGYVNRLEQRLNNLTNKNIDGKGEDRFDPFVIENAIDLLAQYYHKKSDRANLQRVLIILYDSYKKATSQFSAIQKQAHWDKLYRIFNKYQFNDKAKEVLAELQDLSNNVLDEMSKIEMTFEIPQEQFKEYINEMISGTKDEVFEKFIINFIPNKDDSKTQLLSISKNAPLLALCATQLYDCKGRPSSVIGNIEDDIEGNLALYISKTLKVSAIFLHTIIQENISKKNFSKENIMLFLRECPLFENDRLEIINRGIDSYLTKDYLTMLHLLIPQIENAIRTFVELSGHSSLKRQKNNNGFQLKTFDELLRDDAVVQNIGKDFAYYLRLLFTDQKGWNLRNLICHGIMPLNFFNQMTADRVFYALICVASIKIKGSRQL